MSWSSRAVLAAAAAGCTGWLLALATPRDFPPGIFGDDATYAVLAKSLRVDGSYRLMNLPGRPAETKYPPGFPALLALVWSPSLSDTANLERLRWVNLALVGPLAAALAYAGVEAFGLGAAASLALAVSGVLAPSVMAFWTLPLSEPLFLTLVVAALVLLKRGKSLAGIALLVVACYVRTVALAFLAGALVVSWRQRRGRPRLEAAIAVAALVPWIAWTLAHRRSVPAELLGIHGAYGAWYVDSLRADFVTVALLVPLRNALMLLSSLGDCLTGNLGRGVLVPGLLGIALIWAVWSARRVATAAAVGLMLYAAMVVLWPYPPFRFAGAVWPLVLLLAAAGVASLGRRAVWAVAAGALAFGIVGFARGAGVGEGRRGRDWRPLIAAIRPLVPQGAVLATSNPALYYLWLGVPTVPNERMRSYRFYRLGYWSTAWGTGDDVWAIIQRYHPTRVVVERRGVEGRYAVGSLIRQCPGVLTQVWRSARQEFLYSVNPGVPCAPVAVAR